MNADERVAQNRRRWGRTPREVPWGCQPRPGRAGSVAAEGEHGNGDEGLTVDTAEDWCEYARQVKQDQAHSRCSGPRRTTYIASRLTPRYLAASSAPGPIFPARRRCGSARLRYGAALLPQHIVVIVVRHQVGGQRQIHCSKNFCHRRVRGLARSRLNLGNRAIWDSGFGSQLPLRQARLRAYHPKDIARPCVDAAG